MYQKIEKHKGIRALKVSSGELELEKGKGEEGEEWRRRRRRRKKTREILNIDYTRHSVSF